MHDLVTLGEVLLRLSIPSPGRFETARQLDVQVGGAEANVAAACARLGLKVARLTEGDVDWEPVRRARLVHLTGITPALGEGARGLVRRAMREAPVFSFDVNYRASLWSPADARLFLDGVLPEVRYLFLGH